MKTVLVTCGETSGDEHASLLVRKMLSLGDCRVLAMGGERLAEAGAEVLFPVEEFAFMGFFEIIRHLPKVMSLSLRLRRLLASGRVDLFIPVDYPGLNLRLARYARKKGVPVLYYISPQVWAWGGWRIRKIARSVDLMAVILPFEEDYYREAGVPVFYAGHPMLESVPEPKGPKRLPPEGEELDILLFPGSRSQEVDRMLPRMLGAAGIIASTLPEARFTIGAAPMLGDERYVVPPALSGRVRISRRGIEDLEGAHLVIATSGTVTLQTAMSATPCVVVYRTSALTFALGKALVKIPDIAMPNVLAGERVVPELIQGDADAAGIAQEALAILGDEKRYREMSARLLGLRQVLRRDMGLEKLAEKALAMCV